MSTTLLLLSGAVAVATGVGVELVRRWADRRLLDIPNARSSHARPTPRGGGAAIVVAVLTGWVIFLVLLRGRLMVGEVGYLAGAWLIAVVSWLDDLYTVGAKTRLAAHGAGATIALATLGGWPLLELPVVGVVSLGPGGVALAALWIIGLTNAYNFMDGIDGIAGAQGVIAGLGWALLGAHTRAPGVAALGAMLGVACLVFLCWNWAPARIFLGDVGSAFLGYSFAVLPLLAREESPDASLVGSWPLLALLLVWAFVGDTALTFIRRLAKGERVLEAHRTHLYQRLVIRGHPQARIALLYLGFALMGLIAVLLRDVPAWDLGVVAGFPLLLALLWVVVG